MAIKGEGRDRDDVFKKGRLSSAPNNRRPSGKARETFVSMMRSLLFTKKEESLQTWKLLLWGKGIPHRGTVGIFVDELLQDGGQGSMGEVIAAHGNYHFAIEERGQF